MVKPAFDRLTLLLVTVRVVADVGYAGLTIWPGVLMEPFGLHSRHAIQTIVFVETMGKFFA